MSLTKNSIGTVAKAFGVTPYTLRYYEKIGLLPPISKDKSNRRSYSQGDIARLSFIKRAQRMRFSLQDIGKLIDLDRASILEKPQARQMVEIKLSEIAESLADLNQLQNDLSAMLEACVTSEDDQACPIIDRFKGAP
jgi:DNA-binding transcriptional MerR regulator